MPEQKEQTDRRNTSRSGRYRPLFAVAAEDRILLGLGSAYCESFSACCCCVFVASELRVLVRFSQSESMRKRFDEARMNMT